MNLRDYQQSALDAVYDSLTTNQSCLIVMATGTGKTVLFSHIADLFRTTGRVMVIAHREELIHQAAQKIQAITGERPDIEMADQRADSDMFHRAKVIVSSVQTLANGRVERFDPADFSLLITDEAHHAPADSYGVVYRHMLSHGCKHVGVTATPDRADEAALGRVFNDVAFTYDLPTAIDDGYLVNIKQSFVQVTSLDYSGVKTVAGDLNQQDVARQQGSEMILQAMIDPIVTKAGNRKTIIFATPGSYRDDNGVTFHIATRMTEIINRPLCRPGQARRVSQDTPRDVRKQILADFKEGKFQFLVNVGVFTEGFDEPGIEVVAITRPTSSRALYEQMIGRGTRPLPGVVDGLSTPEERKDAIFRSAKPHLEVIDVVGNAGKHKLITTADALGGQYEDRVVERAKQKANTDDPVDMAGTLREAAQEIKSEDEAEQRKREAVVGKAQWIATEIDPFAVFDLAPKRTPGWHVGRLASSAQLGLLKSFGVDIPKEGISLTKASQIIEECKRRKEKGMASYRQMKALKEKGITDVNITAGQAASKLGEGYRFSQWQSEYAAIAGG